MHCVHEMKTTNKQNNRMVNLKKRKKYFYEMAKHYSFSQSIFDILSLDQNKDGKKVARVRIIFY